MALGCRQWPVLMVAIKMPKRKRFRTDRRLDSTGIVSFFRKEDRPPCFFPAYPSTARAHTLIRLYHPAQCFLGTRCSGKSSFCSSRLFLRIVRFFIPVRILDFWTLFQEFQRDIKLSIFFTTINSKGLHEQVTLATPAKKRPMISAWKEK